MCTFRSLRANAQKLVRFVTSPHHQQIVPRLLREPLELAGKAKSQIGGSNNDMQYRVAVKALAFRHLRKRSLRNVWFRHSRKVHDLIEVTVEMGIVSNRGPMAQQIIVSDLAVKGGVHKPPPGIDFEYDWHVNKAALRLLLVYMPPQVLGDSQTDEV